MLTACLIVRNEERFLPACLASLAGVADRIVVVDTGSSDRTIEIARKQGADVFPFEWCDDFAAARNFSISTVRSGFVFRNAYCLGANMGAVCTPSRNMLLSGRAYFRWQGPLAPAEAANFPVSMNLKRAVSL